MGYITKVYFQAIPLYTAEADKMQTKLPLFQRSVKNEENTEKAAPRCFRWLVKKFENKRPQGKVERIKRCKPKHNTTKRD